MPMLTVAVRVHPNLAAFEAMTCDDALTLKGVAGSERIRYVFSGPTKGVQRRQQRERRAGFCFGDRSWMTRHRSILVDHGQGLRQSACRLRATRRDG